MPDIQKIIDGKRYSTTTAEKICGHWNGRDSTDLYYLSEDLYRTPTGRWFVHFEGGACSIYKRPVGNNSSAGDEGIRPLSVSEAASFLEAHGTAEQYEQFFSVEEA